MKKFLHRLRYILIFTILAVSVSAVGYGVYATVCTCERDYCLEDKCPYPGDTINPDYWHRYRHPSGSNYPECTDSSDDYCMMRPAFGEPYDQFPCSQCPYGDPDYGPLGSWNYSAICVISCNGSGGEGTGGQAACEKDNDFNYRCDPQTTAGTERYGLVHQIWNTAGAYTTSDPARPRANYVGYADQMEHGGVKGGLCAGFYSQEFSGYIYIPAGWMEFEIETDYDNSRDCNNKSNCGVDKDTCCRSGCAYCSGASASSKSTCVSRGGTWKQIEPKCNDNGTGVHFGYVGSGTAADPYRPNPSSYIDTASTNTGFPRNMSNAIGAGRDDTFGGYFQDGWYLIRGWYVVGEQGRVYIYNLRYRTDPAVSWDNANYVPSDWFRPCGPAGDPPVCQVTAPPEGSSYTAGDNVSISVAAQDPEDGLQNIGIYYRFSSDGGNSWGNWCKLLNGGCADPATAVPTCNDPVNCTLSRTLNNVAVGDYQAVCNAHSDNKCSGNPDQPLPGGWSQCDPGNAADCIASDACVQFSVGNPAQCRQNMTYAMRFDDTVSPGTWVNTTEYLKPSDPLAIKMSAYDVDKENTLDGVTASCTDNQTGAVYSHNDFINATGSRFTVRARGTQYPGASNGEWPEMRLHFRDDSGAIHFYNACDFVVDSTAWQDYSCILPGGAAYHSYFMIQFPNDGRNPNDFSQDKNLFIDYVVYYPNSADSTKFVTIEGEHAQNVYEIGGTNYNWDGMDLMHFDNPADLAARPSVVTSGRAGMYYQGVLRFPVLWNSPTVTDQTCTVTLDPANTGNVCTQVITSKGFSISGSLLLTQGIDNPTCSDISTAVGLTYTSNNTSVSFWEPPLTSLVWREFLQAGSNVYNIVGKFFGNQLFNSFQTNLADTNALVDYELYCVNVTHPVKGSNAYTASLNSATPVPDYSMDYEDITVDFIFKELGNDKWFQASNGDIYSASPISADIPDFKNDNPGFLNARIFPTLVYRYNNTSDIHISIGGNVFTAPEDPPTIGVDSFGSYVEFAEYYPVTNDYDRGSIFELDGNPTDTIVPSNSLWINEFDFEPPTRFDTPTPQSSGFVLNEVYYITEAAFSSFVSSGQYTLADDADGRSEGVTIIYVNGNTSIDINNDFVNSEPNSRKSLILVYPGRVYIDGSVGHDYDDIVAANYVGYNERLNAPEIPNNIEAVILAGRGIETETVYDGSSVRDRILVVYGMLLAGNKGGSDTVSLNRNLGRIANAEYPAEIVRYNQYVLHYLTILERDLSTTGSSSTGLGESFTGLDDFGVEFIYED